MSVSSTLLELAEKYLASATEAKEVASQPDHCPREIAALHTKTLNLRNEIATLTGNPTVSALAA